MTLAELIAGLDVTLVRGDASVRICDLTEDSRTVMPGSLFVARQGTRMDGRAFVGAACEQGAVAILTDDPRACDSGACDRGPHQRDLGANVALVVARDLSVAVARIAERFYREPSARIPVVGVTGTNGKTTTVHAIHQLLNASGLRCGMIGTVLVDDGREVARASMTTPPAIEVSRTLATMLEHGCRAAAMEASSHALDQGRVAGVRFKVGIFTNLTGDHLDYHKTMDAYADAKRRLFKGLAQGGLAVVNGDDPASDRMVAGCPAPVLRCVARPLTEAERGTDAFCSVEIQSQSLSGTTAAFEGPWGRITAHYGLIGTHNAMNVLQAVAAAHALGLQPAALTAALARLTPPRGRLEPVPSPAGVDAPSILIDYAHTDDGLRKTLEAVRTVLPSGARLWVVFGAGGEKDRTKRPRMGEAASELADMVVVTSDNPRRERPSDIIDEILAGIPASRRDRVLIEADRRHAIERAIAEADPRDVVVIAGKGHETEQVLPDGRGGTVQIHFDDREVAIEALASSVGRA